MTPYVIKRKPPSHDEYKTWVMMGYLGSYDQYAATVHQSAIETVFVHADLVKHCTECAAPSDNLCNARSEEHKSEPQPLMRNSYAVFLLEKKKHNVAESTPLNRIRSRRRDTLYIRQQRQTQQ